jgi:hypothetical protein
MSTSNLSLEGLGGPIKVDEIERPTEVDPTLDSCCVREVCEILGV